MYWQSQPDNHKQGSYRPQTPPSMSMSMWSLRWHHEQVRYRDTLKLQSVTLQSGHYSKQNDDWNSAVLRSRRNCSSDSAERTDGGRAFHARVTPLVLPSVELLYEHVIFVSLRTQGHHVQTWCHKYSTCPLQELVPSVRCMQLVFRRAVYSQAQGQRSWKRLWPKATCKPHCLSLAATSSSLSLCAKMTTSIKPEIRSV